MLFCFHLSHASVWIPIHNSLCCCSVGLHSARSPARPHPANRQTPSSELAWRARRVTFRGTMGCYDLVFHNASTSRPTNPATRPSYLIMAAMDLWRVSIFGRKSRLVHVSGCSMRDLSDASRRNHNVGRETRHFKVGTPYNLASRRVKHPSDIEKPWPNSPLPCISLSTLHQQLPKNS